MKFSLFGLSGVGMVTFANLFSTIFAGIFWISLASFLGVEDYGTVYFDMAIPSILGAISLVGLPTTLIRLSAQGNKTFKFNANIIALLLSILFAIPLLFIHWVLAVFLLTSNFFLMATSLVIGEKSYKEYSIIIIGSRLLQIAFSIFFFEFLGHYGILIGYALSFLIFSYRFFMNLRFKKPDFTEIKQHLTYITHVFGIQVSGSLYSFFDKVVIGSLYGFTNLGLYTLGSQFLNALGFLPSGFSTYLLPEESSGSNTKKIRQIGIILSIALTIIAIFSIPVIINSFFPEYAESIPLAIIMMFSLFPITAISILMSRLLGYGQSKPALIGVIIYVISQISGIVILGQLFDMIGLAISVVVANYIQLIYLWLVTKNMENSHKL